MIGELQEAEKESVCASLQSSQNPPHFNDIT